MPNLERLHSPGTPLWLMLAMENWVEGKATMEEYVRLASHIPFIYTDKSPKNSLHAILGEVGVWNLAQSGSILRAGEHA